MFFITSKSSSSESTDSSPNDENFLYTADYYDQITEDLNVYEKELSSTDLKVDNSYYIIQECESLQEMNDFLDQVNIINYNDIDESSSTTISISQQKL